jgi:hypothetical protein
VILSSILLYFIPDVSDKQVDFVSQLYDLSPIIGLLIFGIMYLLYSIKVKNDLLEKRDAEIKELNEYIRDNEADNCVMLEKLANSLDKVIASHQHDSSAIIKEIEKTKEILSIKIDNVNRK